jgi:hypothetical protein
LSKLDKKSLNTLKTGVLPMKKSLVAFALCSALATGTALADDVKTLRKTVEVEKGQKISFNVPVGSLKVETCDCNEVTVKVKVEPSDGSWNIFSSGNVEDAELSVRQRGNGISFEVDEDDTKQKWRVTMPASSALNIDVGVGQVDVNDFNNSLRAEVGVGQITVDVEGENFDDIKVESGVGDASIRGFSGVDKARAMVSSSAHYRGDGDYSIDVEVGVGEASVR